MQMKTQLNLVVRGFTAAVLVYRYVTGDYRFRNGYCKHNPRKMVQAWAEKEMRNLSRLYDAGGQRHY